MEPINIEYINNKIVYTTYDENKNKQIIEDKDFKPYFYVECNNGEFTSIFGEKAKKVEIKYYYKYIKDLREKYKDKKTFEIDVEPALRYVLDKFNAPFSDSIFRYWMIDIEVNNSLDYINTPKEIISITIYDNFENTFYQFGLTSVKQGLYDKKMNRYILLFNDEKELLNRFLQLYKNKSPDVLIGWNIQYDINYLVNRMKKLGINYKELSQFGIVSFNKNNTVRKIYGLTLMDLMKLYRKLKSKSLESTSLENVAFSENLTIRKLPKPDFNKYNNINEILKILEYNLNDVLIMIELDKKLNIINFFEMLRRIIGLAWNQFIDQNSYDVYNFKIVDTYVLRKAHEKGYILPSNNDKTNNENESYEGALVLEPPVGILKNVIVLDVNSMYPNIIRTYNISPETLINSDKNDNENVILSPLNYKFVKNKYGLITEIISELFELRKQYKELKKQYNPTSKEYIEYDLKQLSIKIILNSFYGSLGYYKFRLYKKECAESITAFGRELLKFIISKLESRGYKVVYGDTDSVFVKLDDNLSIDEIINKSKEIEEYINKSFDEFAKKWNVDKHYHKIELKFIFKNILFSGAKKRYIGYYVYNEDGKNEGIEIKGFQLVRSDASDLQKEILNTILNMLLKENKSIDDALKYITIMKNKVLNNEIDVKKLFFKSSFSKEKEYKSIVPHLVALHYAKKLNLIDEVVSGKVFWIYIYSNDSINVNGKLKHVEELGIYDTQIDKLIEFMKTHKIKIDYKKVIERTFSNIEELLMKLKGKYEIFRLVNHDYIREDSILGFYFTN